MRASSQAMFGVIVLASLVVGPVEAARRRPNLGFRPPQAGECASGFCGTPYNNGGGGCGCGCGGAVLVANTDKGLTYSVADDFDVDGFEDDFDNCPFIANIDQLDSDGDAFGNACDNAPDGFNPGQEDLDGDGSGDVADPELDGDGILNIGDNCASVFNANQLDSDADGVGNACDPTPGIGDIYGTGDMDSDGQVDLFDNCVMIANSGQEDLDGDGVGDQCDRDRDGDNVPDPVDSCPELANADDDDFDRDQIGDACDPHTCMNVAYSGDAECLDPVTPFNVRISPNAQITVGTSVPLRLFANRQNAAIRYSFVVLTRPEGSDATVEKPVGSVSVSDPDTFGYEFQGEPPTFTPDVEGSYEIRVSADLVDGDNLFPEVSNAVSSIQLVVVKGDGTEQAGGGCSVPPSARGSRASSLGALSSLLLALGLVLARRQRGKR